MVPRQAQLATAVLAANALANQAEVAQIDPTLLAKVPVQERGKARFNAIITAAEELVLELGIDNVSSHKIAKRAGIPAASVYQYFPTMGALFAVMAEKHYAGVFSLLRDTLDDMEIRSWRDLASVIVDVAYDFYTQDKLCEILFLDFHQGPGVNEFADSRLARMGLWFIELFYVLYKKSDLDALPEKLTICVQITETVFRRSLNVHGEITETYKEEARILVLNYLGDFFSSIER